MILRTKAALCSGRPNSAAPLHPYVLIVLFSVYIFSYIVSSASSVVMCGSNTAETEKGSLESPKDKNATLLQRGNIPNLFEQHGRTGNLSAHLLL